MTEQTQTERKENHLTVYLIWPLLGGPGLAGLLAVSVGGIMLMASGFNWALAGAWMGYTFFVVLGLATVAIFVYAAMNWAGPRFIERTRQDVQVIEPDPVVPEPRFIRVGGRPAPLTLPAPAQPGDRQSLVVKAIDVLAHRLKQQELITVDHDVPSLEPDALPWVREFYAVTCRMWAATRPDGVLSRRLFESEFKANGKALYYKYVGSATDKGLWQTWGIIDPGARGSWVFNQPLEVILSLDDAVRDYAARMSGLRLLPHQAGDQSKPDTGPGQTRPDRSDQTREEHV
ncbi:MAG: hypothetical protein JW934_20880 [Anaerolineae bacterium]|nr:hypothetical protein [Anaerolineae bacterium]